jgi:hypothetical protein
MKGITMKMTKGMKLMKTRVTQRRQEEFEKRNPITKKKKAKDKQSIKVRAQELMNGDLKENKMGIKQRHNLDGVSNQAKLGTVSRGQCY